MLHFVLHDTPAVLFRDGISSEAVVATVYEDFSTVILPRITRRRYPPDQTTESFFGKRIGRRARASSVTAEQSGKAYSRSASERNPKSNCKKVRSGKNGMPGLDALRPPAIEGDPSFLNVSRRPSRKKLMANSPLYPA